ncbi:CotH kinase family protein [Maribacter halichondriae]|uniref:CotH kinase family protein n=1 Tax=Maribacter halichondriae TaxID=2980554 RepID=UPI002359993A|nr:CotH kinase family protein [Maribacter sp. Hal144]
MVITTPSGTDYNGNIGIEIRGASSQFFAKKSFGVETRDASNADLDVSLLGMPEEEDWVLHGPFSDKSLMRNKLIYDLSREMGMYASRTEFAELTINGSYQGLYVFMEKLKRDDERINISTLNPDENSGEDLTGGYILKIDKINFDIGESYSDLNSFNSAISPPNATQGQTIRFLYEDPEPDEITTEQKIYISDYVTQFETVLSSNTFSDPATGYAAHIDVASFIDFFLLNELSNNVDGYRLSTFMYKDKNEKLKMGPIWDFNLAFGNADYCSGGETNVWAYKFNERCSEDFWLVPFWWERLLEDPAYVAQLKERWTTLRGSVFSEATIEAKIEEYLSAMASAGAIDKNFGKWNILGSYVWPNNYVGISYNDDLGYFREWITNRLIWLDGSIEAL